ncbi:hypothetical protein [Streptomyces rubradiris]|uniref:Uncharacterized protein n=1 Tax=Streptomyces rubradiris TaxID=285531 RepID=A0ABQ3R8Y5_STRRR|nr:hypothetical protein [Streptomyces rubradiris]GHG99074.1 hypothetical protein GCM10018792_12170 [Streptomyces rubradiris]GHI52316.1 hypothetical protein Srubr_21620 [Streptomyces rubradiris]
MKRLTSMLSAAALTGTALIGFSVASAASADAAVRNVQSVQGCYDYLLNHNYELRDARKKACYEGAKGGAIPISNCVRMMLAAGVTDPGDARGACNAAAART